VATTMIRGLLLGHALAAGLWAGEATAGVSFGAGTELQPRPLSQRVQLAQFDDVEIYVDQYGRRVVVDPYTGEVLGVERPRGYRRALRAREFEEPPELYDDDIPYRPRPYLNGRPLDGDPYVYDPDYEEFPEAPPREFPEPPEVSRVPAEPERVTRRPLEPAEQRQSALEPSERQSAVESDGQSTGSVAARAPKEESPALTEPGQAPRTYLSPSVREEVAALQVLLDRKGASPGVIDGRFGENVDKALLAYREITGENLRSIDTDRIREALAASGGDPFTTYTITAEDAAGPFVASVPEDYGAKAKLERLSYTSVTEMLAERFHMDEAFLKALNLDANFSRPGTVVKVANVGADVTGKVTRIVADKRKKQVRAFDQSGKMIAAYPATIGSADTPSPSGTHKIARIAFDPEYTYNPKLNFKQGDNERILTIPPGPNGPVGSIWIALDKPTYGIHGTPEPSKIGKTESHGCVRLTNWDARELARLVEPGVTVEFVE
jgi:lipoprotein-anchoring transpeptidase ErfK/SrfK